MSGKPEATMAAIKFCVCGVVLVGYGVLLVVAPVLTPYKVFLYTLAAGVLVKLAWPTQDEGDALLNRSNTK